MSVLALGLNHHHTPLALREQFALGGTPLPHALQALRDSLWPLPAEVSVLSTCNRTEVYVAAATVAPWPATEVVPVVARWWANTCQTPVASLHQHLDTWADSQATRHVFRVASGLDSMVLGEPQILGQLKQAVRQADAAGTLGTTLHQLFQRCFTVAKEVRSTTLIGAHSVSMAAASVRLAQQLFGAIDPLRVLFIGAGDMIEDTAAHFAGHRPRQLVVANRTLSRAEALAHRHRAQVMPLAEVPKRLHEFDVVVSCTASTLPILGLGAVERAVKARRHRPMCMVDLAVPRDIEQEVSELPDIYLYTIDDLASVVRTGGQKRQSEVAKAEAIVDAGVQGFERWLDQRAAVPVIQAVQEQVGVWQDEQIRRAHRRLARGDDIDAVMRALAKGLSAQMLHGPLAELRQAQGQQREAMEDWLSKAWVRSRRSEES